MSVELDWVHGEDVTPEVIVRALALCNAEQSRPTMGGGSKWGNGFLDGMLVAERVCRDFEAGRLEGISVQNGSLCTAQGGGATATVIPPGGTFTASIPVPEGVAVGPFSAVSLRPIDPPGYCPSRWTRFKRWMGAA